MVRLLIIIQLAMMLTTSAIALDVKTNVYGADVEICHVDVERELTDYEVITYSIKSLESFRHNAFDDYKQQSNGWGTKAKRKGERITLSEANSRYVKTYTKHFNRNRKRDGKYLSEWQVHVMTSFTYNVGGIKKKSGLHKAIIEYGKTGDPYTVTNYMMKYNKVRENGKIKVLDGLTARRRLECLLFTATPLVKQRIGEKSKQRVKRIIAKYVTEI